ncbi:hypothetical protein A2961_01620 [Candidatus Woesebacteria bacterium RIFCSPLOWO2_01_FULL_39_21]|uniref:PABS domain-containing protein n=1 Tax=Candidatus Woesebacteria bacterium RIFCSPLOWO2_01_FULL_39_21 TaxID=1802519 RepID=A0A1F8BMW3_9BACT|nr:MAG: hypothetical protein A2691_00920 [Candidatus Woesebacteria bacterium RIFCSPHIGHO2_01_FULL_39_23]OGM65290.1 MAG: hypothetical protein A2961_01620 [Candidatus Woesebacteria bacterium RIFCSPLOWO2_01_FULL_39_21]
MALNHTKVFGGKNNLIKTDGIGIFFMSMAMLMYEILLTRIFSVTMMYHFAFMAVSLAMFGLSAGAVLVFKKMSSFNQSQIRQSAVLGSLFFSLSSSLGITLYALAPISIFIAFLFSSIPFVFGGMVITLALTKLGRDPGKMYAADLGGAALGCLLLLFVMNFLDGVAASWLVAAISCFGALAFVGVKTGSNLVKINILLIAVFTILSLVSAISNLKGEPLVQIRISKGRLTPKPVWEGWNSYSRITVVGNKDRLEKPLGWGLSDKYSGSLVNQLNLLIDSGAGTALTKFDGDLSKLDFLKYDITSVAHYLKTDAEVLVIGMGGGRDVLTGLVFDQKKIVGVDINEKIFHAVNTVFGNFTGHLDKNPKVEMVVGDGRNFVAESDRKYDLIQLSLIDTWAATSTGAYSLTENGLYTTQAWKLFLEHLKPLGVLTVSRWYYNDFPVEVYRLVDLAKTGLSEIGVDKPKNNVIVVWQKVTKYSNLDPDGVATLLVSKDGFSDTDIKKIQKVSNDLGFGMLYAPNESTSAMYDKLLDKSTGDDFYNQFKENIKAPTDDNPFFFQLMKLNLGGDYATRMSTALGDSSKLLVRLFVLVSILCGLFVLVPSVMGRKRLSLGPTNVSIYFAGIGLGYMLVEISQMQRLMIFLGTPTLSLAVVLFGLLLSGGLGSYFQAFFVGKMVKRRSLIVLLAVLTALVVSGWVIPGGIRSLGNESQTVKILFSLISIMSLGFFMGMPFGVGMRASEGKFKNSQPWLWSINGAFSVMGSVLAIIVAIGVGISTAYWLGVISYIVAFGSFSIFSRR